MLQNYKNVELVKPGGLELKDRLVGVQRVTKVTKGGRAFGFSAIVVVGDENGVVGQGLGKSKEVAEAISKAVEDAKKNLVRIPIAKGTVPHEQKGKYGGARVFLKPASEGTGVIAGGAVRAVLEAVGVHNVLSKSHVESSTPTFRLVSPLMKLIESTSILSNLSITTPALIFSRSA